MVLNFNQLVTKYNLNIQGVIQIGAHHGEEDELYQKLNINNVMYFEPVSSNYKILKKSVPSDRILYNCALGNENKTIEMYVETENKGQSCSILKPEKHIEQYPQIIFNQRELVEMKRLDDIDFDNKKYNFINIDVQGYELEVFKGASKTLENIDYIVSELNKTNLYENCSLVEDVELYLSNYGFELVEVDWIGKTWGDGLFIKKQ